jgi:RHH-type transcriptional regulator, rel operon repressor / antitoxin RelB
MLALRLPPDIEERLDDLAKKTGRSKSFYAREAILSYLEDIEDTYLALKALEEGGEPISLEELMKEYGLEAAK